MPVRYASGNAGNRLIRTLIVRGKSDRGKTHLIALPQKWRRRSVKQDFALKACPEIERRRCYIPLRFVDHLKTNSALVAEEVSRSSNLRNLSQEGVSGGNP